MSGGRQVDHRPPKCPLCNEPMKKAMHKTRGAIWFCRADRWGTKPVVFNPWTDNIKLLQSESDVPPEGSDRA